MMKSTFSIGKIFASGFKILTSIGLFLLIGIPVLTGYGVVILTSIVSIAAGLFLRLLSNPLVFLIVGALTLFLVSQRLRKD